MNRKVIRILMLIAAVAVFSALTAASAEEMTSEGFSYYIKEDGTAEITGYNTAEGSSPWTPFSVPDEYGQYCDITSIAAGAFENSSIEAMYIRDTITEIGEGAFRNCTNLTDIHLMCMIDIIPDNCFEGCTSLTEIITPEISYIGKRAFYGCTGMTNASITSPSAASGIEPVIGESAFENCVQLEMVGMNNYWHKIGERAFAGCTSLIQFEADHLNEIGDYAFAGCEILNAFRILNQTLGRFSETAFENCHHLVLMIFSNSGAAQSAEEYGIETEYIDCIDPVTGLTYMIEAQHEIAVILDCPDDYSGPLAIPSSLDGYSVRNIAYGAFHDIKNITSVTIPDSVRYIADGAFARSSVTEVHMPASADGGTLASVFYQCENLTRVTGTEEYGYISESMFSGCINLKSVDFPSLQDIGRNAFKDCRSLESFILPASIYRIDETAFDGCDRLVLKTYRETEGHYFVQQYGFDYILLDADEWSEPYATTDNFFFYSISDGCAVIDRFAANYWGPVIVPSKLEGYPVVIDSSAFQGREITSVTVSEGIEQIGSGAFSRCEQLTRAELPDSLTEIGSGLFENCSSLAEVRLPSGMTEIPDRFFYGCSSLETVALPSDAERIGYAAFADCSALEALAIPDTVNYISPMAFAGCGMLETLAIPSTVNYIGYDAFDGCDRLTLAVTAGSYAEEYAQKNNIPCAVYSVPVGLSADYIEVAPGDRFRIAAIPPSENALLPELVYSSSNPEIADVDENGIVTVTGINGDVDYVVITVSTADGNFSEECELHSYPMKVLRIPGSLTEIREEAFDAIPWLETVDLSNCSNVQIGENAFRGCEYLFQVILPANTVIADNAFDGCVEVVFFCASEAQMDYALSHGFSFVERVD